MRPRFLASLLFLLPLLAGCQMPYHPLKGGEGFMEVPVGPESYQVSFIGDADMSVTEARRFAMLRAAELAALHDEPYFQIQSEHIYISARNEYWPPSDVGFVQGYRGRFGRTRGYIRYGYGYGYGYGYEPGYMETYMIPDVEMQVLLTSNGAAPSIPAGYLLRQAQADRIKLSPGVAERIPGLPSQAVPLPPEPTPTAKPAPITQPTPMMAPSAPPAAPAAPASPVQPGS